MKRLNLIQRQKLPIHDLEQYYIKMREERFNNGTLLRNMSVRKKVHPVFIPALHVIHYLNKQKVTIIGDKRVKSNRPVVYAATHIGWDDVEMILTAIKEHTYVFWGDPRESYKQLDGLLLDINGVICTDLYSKTDRNIGKESCINCLQKGYNLLLFPEGAWNITESTPVMHLYSGVSEIAIRAEVDVVPIAIEQYGQHFIVNIGENIDLSGFDVTQKDEAKEVVRQKMAELKWDIWCLQGNGKRDDVPADYRENYLKNMEEQMQGILFIEDVDDQRFHTKFERETEKIAKDLENVTPNSKTAFLYNKRLKTF